MILFSNVSRKVSKNINLCNISFKINRNEFVFIYDENKKSLSLLRELLCGSLKPTEGLIRIMNYKSTPDIFNKEIGVVFRDNILLPGRSLNQNYKFILDFMGEDRNYKEIRCDKILDIVGLKSCGDLFPKDLLYHQLVRANIGQSLLLHPSFVVIEDSTLKLDEVNSQAIYHLLEKINRLGITVVFLCSDQRMISRNKNKRVIYLKEGKILAEKNKGHFF